MVTAALIAFALVNLDGKVPLVLYLTVRPLDATMEHASMRNIVCARMVSTVGIVLSRTAMLQTQ